MIVLQSKSVRVVVMELLKKRKEKNVMYEVVVP